MKIREFYKMHLFHFYISKYKYFSVLNSKTLIKTKYCFFKQT